MPSAPSRQPVLRRQPIQRPLSAIDLGMRTLEVVGSIGPTTSIQLQRAVFSPVSHSPRQARSRATRSLRQLFDAGFLTRIRVLAPSAASGLLSRQVVHALSGAGARALG